MRAGFFVVIFLANGVSPPFAKEKTLRKYGGCMGCAFSEDKCLRERARGKRRTLIDNADFKFKLLSAYEMQEAKSLEKDIEPKRVFRIVHRPVELFAAQARGGG